MIKSGTNAKSGLAKVLKAKSIEMKVIAMPASADRRAARGVTLRIQAPKKLMPISMRADKKQAKTPTRQAKSESPVCL